MVKIKELTPENVLNALADKGVIDKDIKINKFEVSEVDGMQSINIDFDQNLKSILCRVVLRKSIMLLVESAILYKSISGG